MRVATAVSSSCRVSWPNASQVPLLVAGHSSRPFFPPPLPAQEKLSRSFVKHYLSEPSRLEPGHHQRQKSRPKLLLVIASTSFTATTESISTPKTAIITATTENATVSSTFGRSHCLINREYKTFGRAHCLINREHDHRGLPR
ncbi:hypothetical protein LR48_Vigan10g192000 [Vigna angularis]|uniref:Uncharacterized protein n=2 Tax=Phaseolus angularis TaxID=3914 RepID=A0A0L9VM36_PHAAN|nr:hypothetical protein LR48_Vigan10g192000 [Vigna angularis]BAU01782.1 hypothetical protein VIGAN_11109000 [Vigna angularis var. angularis]